MKTQSTFVASTSLLKAKADNLFGTSLELSFSGIPENKAYTLWKDLSKELSILEKVLQDRFGDKCYYEGGPESL